MFLNGRLHAEEMSNRGWVHFEVIRKIIGQNWIIIINQVNNEK